MRIIIDEESDALYFRIDESKIIESEEASPGVVLDFNEQNEVVGIEIRNLSKRSSPINLKSLLYEAV